MRVAQSPAQFAQNIQALTGQPYAAQILDQTEDDEMLESPMEKYGKGTLPDGYACQGKCLGWTK